MAKGSTASANTKTRHMYDHEACAHFKYLVEFFGQVPHQPHAQFP